MILTFLKLYKVCAITTYERSVNIKRTKEPDIAMAYCKLKIGKIRPKMRRRSTMCINNQ